MAEHDLFRREAVGRVFNLVVAGVDLTNQTIAPSADRRNIVELWRVRELREFQRRFADYGAAINNKP